ncbi:hypothetical protein [Mesorhizobium sp.]|uniref:hypothetical protein n=1 Tax=Mesorhizobium sp. TaxID=1871066 RepID=UPI0025802314|nr:hypothetical protein [Mesorhizobium sp.]
MADLWECTPRELVGWMYFSERVKKRRRAEFIADGTMAARGDHKDVNKLIDKLGRG